MLWHEVQHIMTVQYAALAFLRPKAPHVELNLHLNHLS